MARLDRLQTNFTAGVLSPRMRGRLDFDGYVDGAETLENMIVLAQGGAIRRPGTRFVVEVKDSSKTTRLIPFIFSTTQAYIIEAGDQYFRFIADSAQVTSSGLPVEVSTPYTAAMLANLSWTQSADILYLAHPSEEPRELHRTSSTAFSLSLHDFQDGPYLEVNTTSTTLTPSGTTGSISLTASATTGINDGSGFQATDVGRLIRFKDSAGNWTWLKITAVTSTTVVQADVKGADLATTTATTDWRLGAWSDTTGWPSAVTFHKQRLWWGGTTDNPQTLWSSVAGDFTNYQPSAADGTVASDDGITVTLDTNTVNAINWLLSTQIGLLVGTAGSEMLLSAASSSSGISPTNIEADTQTKRGSRSGVLPTEIGQTILFVQRDGRTIQELVFDFNAGVEGGFIDNDRGVLAEHLLRNGVARLAYQQAPLSVVWGCTDDGQLIGLTYLRPHRVFAWHSHTIGGTAVAVKDVAVIPEPTRDDLYLLVSRTINSITKQYIEVLDPIFEGGAVADAFFVDSGLTGTSGSPTTSWSGLSHLEGETVAILGDGAVQPSKVVSGGAVTLDRAVSKVQIGLAQSAKVRTMPAELATESLTTTGKTKRIIRAYILFNETVGAQVGYDDTHMDTLPFRSAGDPMDQPVPLFTGYKEVLFPYGYDEEVQVQVVNDQPLPMHILSITAKLTTE